MDYREINIKDINFAILENPEAWEKYSSFSNDFLTKYNFKSVLWNIFNFNNLGNSCNWIDQKYGNLMLNSTTNNIPDIVTIEYQTPLKNGWIYQNRRFERQVLNFELEVSAPNIEKLEKEIQLMKQSFNQGWRVYKKYNWQISFLDVILKDFEVSELKNSGTNIKITFESLVPFFISENFWVKNFENITEKFKSTIIISDSDIEPPFLTILQINNWNCRKIILNNNWYEIEINNEFNFGDIIIFDWKKLSVTKNWKEILYFWEFSDFKIWEPNNISLNFEEWNLTNYNLYFLYDKIIL